MQWRRRNQTEVRPAILQFNRGKIVNDYGTTGNNGNLVKQTVYVPNSNTNDSPTSWYQQYDYDSLNRLGRVREFNSSDAQLWKQTYVYDRYGNRTIDYDNTTSGIPRPQFTVSTSSNRLGVPSGQSGTMSYDSAGNLTTDTYSAAAVTRLYDAENRMTKETQANSYDAGIYSYDGDGRRVKRNVGGVETWQVYGVGGELIAEYAANTAASSPQKEYGYRNGQLLVTVTAASAGWGSAPSYTGPNPLTTGNDIKLENLTELRTAVNSLRAHAGLSAYNFTVDPNPVRYETTVKADHIRQLRTALEEARTHLGLSTGGYTHSTLTEDSSVIYAIDFQEIRNQIASAWNNSTSSLDLRWMVTDQLGTPRIILDQSGSLATTSRHDYLPFGEEIFAGTGGRTTAQGYSTTDGVRQQFSQKERDNETGLDYFGFRYFASAQGRFVSPDPLLSSGRIEDPQTWNRYNYVLGNPLRFSDPLGLFIYADGTSDDDKKRINQAYKDLQKARDHYKVGSKEYKEIDRSLSALGAPGTKNGVIVQVDNSLNTPGKTDPSYSLDSNGNVSGSEALVRLNLNDFKNNDAGKADLAGALGHEGTHVADGQSDVTSLFLGKSLDKVEDIITGGLTTSHAITEVNAYRVSSYIAAAISPSNQTGTSVNGYEIWNRGWSAAEAPMKREIGIRFVLQSSQGSYKYRYSGGIPLPMPFFNLDCGKCWTTNGGSMFR